MGNRCSKIRKNIYKKRYSIYTFCTWSVFFAILYIFTKIFNCSLCPIYHLFNVKCFGCGMTRAFICVFQLDFISAFKYNVMSIPLFFCIIFYVVLFVIDLILDKSYIKQLEKILLKKYMFVIYLMILVVSTYMNNL